MSVRLSALDRRRQIMRAASGLFARHGYGGTTTRQIAERAQINEALLFRHFPSKAKLYWTIIEEQCSARGRKDKIKAILERGGSDNEVFAAIAREFLIRNARDTELTRLLWFTALESHSLSRRFFRTYVAVYYEALAEYIRRRMSEGAFRNVDPLLSARGFLGMVVYHFLVQELFGGEKYQKFDPEAVADSLAGIWLNGMQNGVGRAASNGTARRAHSNEHNGRSRAIEFNVAANGKKHSPQRAPVRLPSVAQGRLRTQRELGHPIVAVIGSSEQMNGRNGNHARPEPKQKLTSKQKLTQRPGHDN